MLRQQGGGGHYLEALVLDAVVELQQRVLEGAIPVDRGGDGAGLVTGEPPQLFHQIGGNPAAKDRRGEEHHVLGSEGASRSLGEGQVQLFNLPGQSAGQQQCRPPGITGGAEIGHSDMC